MRDLSSKALCGDGDLASLTASIGEDERLGFRQLEGLLGRYPDDPRLHFLKGSLLASQQDYAEARTAMRRAVDLAPDYAIARFQLGFLLLTCGEAYAAQESWGPLHGLPSDNYLRMFVEGLCHLIRDEFDEAVSRLRDGIARNQENPALNNDMNLIIAEAERQPRRPDDDASVSSTQMLLQQAALKATKH